MGVRALVVVVLVVAAVLAGVRSVRLEDLKDTTKVFLQPGMTREEMAASYGRAQQPADERFTLPTLELPPLEQTRPLQPGATVQLAAGATSEPVQPGMAGTVEAELPGERFRWLVRWETGEETAVQYGGGQYDVLVVEQDPRLEGVQITDRVPRLEWDPAQMFPEQLALLDSPVILRNTAAAQWRAAAWNASHLRATLPETLRQVKTTRRAPGGWTPFFYFHHSPMNAHPDLVAAQRRKAFTTANMSRDAFFEAMGATDSEEAVMYAAKLDDWGLDLAADAFPLEPLMVLPPDYRPQQEHLYRQTHVWMGPKGSVTPAHLDIYHNFYVHLMGRKRFLLFSPDHWEQLYLHPLIHPGGRSAQVDLNAPYEEQAALFPNFRKVSAHEAILEPGDVLYVPPLWFHHVTALEFSVSVSVWSNYTSTRHVADLMANVPLPIMRTWTAEQRAQALRVYIESLVASLKVGMGGAEFVHWTLLQNRYHRIPGGSEEGGPYCWSDAAHSIVILEGEELIRNQVKQSLELFRRVTKVGGLPRRDIFLANYIELAASSIVGPQHTKQFLHDLVYC